MVWFSMFRLPSLKLQGLSNCRLSTGIRWGTPLSPRLCFHFCWLGCVFSSCLQPRCSSCYGSLPGKEKGVFFFWVDWGCGHLWPRLIPAPYLIILLISKREKIAHPKELLISEQILSVFLLIVKLLRHWPEYRHHQECLTPRSHLVRYGSAGWEAGNLSTRWTFYTCSDERAMAY